MHGPRSSLSKASGPAPTIVNPYPLVGDPKSRQATLVAPGLLEDSDCVEDPTLRRPDFLMVGIALIEGVSREC